MVNSKGGFLIEDGKEVDEDMLRKEKERERQRIQKNMEPGASRTPRHASPTITLCSGVSGSRVESKMQGVRVYFH